MTLEEKRDEACIEYVGFGYGCDGDTSGDSFKAGWNACAKEYEQNIFILEHTIQQLKNRHEAENEHNEEVEEISENLCEENTKLKHQLEIVKEALQFYAEFTGEFKPYNTSQDFIINWGHTAQEALKELESAGE